MELDEEIFSEKIELAVLYFRSKKYEQCTALFSELIDKMSGLNESRVLKIRKYYALNERPAYGKLVHPKLCGILDQRAATYEKLGSNDMALQDARKMISIDPVNCKGYLRLGKILQKMGDKIKTYRTYQKGVYLIRKASETYGYAPPERLWHQLQSSYKELNGSLKEEREKTKLDTAEELKGSSFFSNLASTQHTSVGLQSQLEKMLPLKRLQRVQKEQKEHNESLVQTKRVKVCTDIFLIFPKEVIELIFAQLPFQDILRYHVVCKLWYNSLLALPSLYRDRFILKHRITIREYLHGLKLMKRVSAHSFSGSIGSVKVWSTFNIHHLGKIIENIICDSSLKLSRLNIIDKNLSLELILQKLERCRWEYTSLATVRHLRLGINSSLYNGKILFGLFPCLKDLEVLSVECQLRKSNISMIPHYSDTYTQLVKQCGEIKNQTSLKRLSLVNHPHLKRGFQPTRSGDMSFDPSPLFVDVCFPALTELKLTNYDFSGMAVAFQAFLRKSPCLTELYFEDNEELPLKKFILLLASCAPAFKLTKFTFRELQQEVNYLIDEVSSEELSCFHGLTHLDIYGSSISKSGFLKFLAIANEHGHLSSINIGHSSHIQFRNDNFAAPNSVLTFYQLFDLVPGIEALAMPELSLDNFSIRLLKETLNDYYSKHGLKINLKHLDLSFCHSIDGTGLVHLFSSSAQSNTKKFTLDTLILNGLHIKTETLDILRRKELVKNIYNDLHKKKWRSYNVNSQVFEIE